jgi:hypothetical protein
MELKSKKYLSSLELQFVGNAEDHFSKALRMQMELHEGVTLFDLMKFLYQSSLGSFHLFEMMGEAKLLDWVRKNLENTHPSDGPLTEDLLSKKWVRVNLGPYKKKFGNDCQRICEMFIKAKSLRQGQLRRFRDLLEKLLGAFRKGEIKSVPDESNIADLVRDFLLAYEEEDFPIVHHSKIYMQKNSSDYLVVPRSSLDRICGTNVSADLRK